MYDLTLLNKYNIAISWGELYASIKADLLTPQSASQYASDLENKGLLPDNMSELLWETNDKSEIKKIL